MTIALDASTYQGENITYWYASVAYSVVVFISFCLMYADMVIAGLITNATVDVRDKGNGKYEVHRSSSSHMSMTVPFVGIDLNDRNDDRDCR
jgi:hypothetical protein